jgi:hypothetical protein
MTPTGVRYDLGRAEEKLGKMNQAEKKLDELMVNYREACPEPGEAMHFMPRLWHRIEAQRQMLKKARGWTSGVVTLAATICLLLALLLSLQSNPMIHNYLEALDSDQDAAPAIEGSAQSDSVLAKPSGEAR